MTMSANGGGAPIGWYAVGTGKQMDGSNMMVSHKISRRFQFERDDKALSHLKTLLPVAYAS